MAAGAKGGGAGAFAGAAGGVRRVYTWPWHFVPNHAPVTLKTVSERYGLFTTPKYTFAMPTARSDLPYRNTVITDSR
jgi:hypothetical protein